LSRNLPPFERPPRPLAPRLEAPEHRRYNPFLIFGIAAFAVAAFYLLLVVVTAADEIFLPGNEIKIGVLAKIPGVDSSKKPEFADINQRINILFLGLDIRRDEPPDMPARTDSVFILTVDPYSKTAGVFSIPRDLLVEIPDGAGGYIKDRINVAYEMGDYTYKDYPGGGPGLAKDTIEHNFGIPIDYYVILNFNNFIDLIDEIGGVDIDVPEYAFDPAYDDCNRCPYYALEFLPGPQHMDGETALAYARIRASDNDFKRIERQQLVIRATAKKALGLDVLLPDNALSLYKHYKESVKSDIPDFKIGGLALLAKQVGVDNLRTVSIAAATYDCAECSAAVLLANWDKVEEMKTSVFGDGRLQVEAASIEVQNGTETPGLAGEFAAFLEKQGLGKDQIAVDEYASGALHDRTLVINLNGKAYTAERIAKWLNLPATRIKTAADPEAAPFLRSPRDVVVVLGADAGLSSPPAASGG